MEKRPQPEIETTYRFPVEGFPRNIMRRRAYILGQGKNVARTCAEYIAEAPGCPLAPATEAWALLAHAGLESRNNPERSVDAMNQILLDPPTGTWEAYMVRLAAGGEELNDPNAQWGHAGYLHCMAAAAAINAGLDFSITVPTWDGCVTLPTIGQAILTEQALAAQEKGGRWSVATVQSSGGRTVILDAAGNIQCIIPQAGQMEQAENWQPFQTLSVPITGSDEVFALSLDHFNPYRFNDGPVAPLDDTDRLTPEQETAWLAQLQAGMTLLGTDHPMLAGQIAAILKTVVPSSTTSIRFRPASSSAGDSVGATTIGWQYDATEMACTLVHEGHHNLLYALMMQTALLKDVGERKENLYAPWRDDPRHDYGLLHGVVSFLAVTEFYHQRALITSQPTADQRVAQFSFAHWFQQAYYAKEELETQPNLTPDGVAFMNALTGRFKAMQDPDVPEDIAALADKVVSYHRSRWAAHHLRLDNTEWLKLQWFGGVTVAGMSESYDWVDISPPHLHFEPEAWRFDTWHVLACMAIAEPERLQELLQNPSTIAEHVQGATHADVLYFAGNRQLAAKLYQETLSNTETYDNPGAIVGLGFASTSQSAYKLLELPYTYRAIQRMTVERFGKPAPPSRVTSFLWGKTSGNPVGPQSRQLYQPEDVGAFSTPPN